MSPRSIRPQDAPSASCQTGVVTNSMPNGLSSERAFTGYESVCQASSVSTRRSTTSPVDPHLYRLGGGHGRHPADIECNVRVLGRRVEDRVFAGAVDASAGLTCCVILNCRQSDRILSALRCTIVRRSEHRLVIAPGVRFGDSSVDREHIEGVEEG